MTDGTAHVSAKLIDAQRIESGSGEGIVRIHSVVAEVFICRAVHVVATRFGDRAHHRTQVAAIVAGVWAVDDAKFLHPVERGAGPLHAGEADRVVGAVEREEGAMRLAQSAKAKLEYRFEKRRLGCGGRAAADVGGGSQQHEIDEVAACNGKVVNLGGRDDLARFHLLGVDGRRGGLDTETLCFTAATPSWTSTDATWPTVNVSGCWYSLKPSALTDSR